MNRLLSIMFAIVLVWNYLGFFVIFHVEKQAVKKSIKRQLKLSVPKDDLVEFQFTQEERAELIWFKANEFSHQGNMFDIVYTDTLENGKLKYTCISDKQETALFRNLEQFVAQDLNLDHNKPIKVWKVNLVQPFVIEDFPTIVLRFMSTSQLSLNSSYLAEECFGHSSRVFQPPRAA